MSAQGCHSLITLITRWFVASFLLFVALAVAAKDASVLRKRAPVCYGDLLEYTSSITPTDCVQAAYSMPTTATKALFGTHAPDGSASKLPRHFAFGRCMIGVSMANSLANGNEWSSWSDITRAAYDIITDCVSRHRLARRGGMDRVGQSRQIVVEIFLYQHHLNFLIGNNDPKRVSDDHENSIGDVDPADWRPPWVDGKVPVIVK